MFSRPKEIDEPVSAGEKAKLFFSVHWRGIFVIIAPLIFLFLVVPFPGETKTLSAILVYRFCAVASKCVTCFVNKHFTIPTNDISKFLTITSTKLYGKYSNYHYCIVRECKNTSIKSPGKLWIRAPTNMRNNWLRLAKRDPESISTAQIYFCEDHFDEYMWVAYTLIIMALFWVTECIPLAVTGFIPMIVFPLRGVSSTDGTCRAYINDTLLMFLGSLFLASSVEQSGFHKRLAYFAIRMIGYSHIRLLLAMCVVTTFVSMWITNTAAVTMVAPIIFALLKVFEDQKVLVIYDKTPDGDDVASDITACYFCAATYSATVGGIGTLVGTATNLVFKGLFMDAYPYAPEYLSFPLFSAFAVPYMIVLEIFVYLYLAVVYLGMFRGNSETAKKAEMPEIARIAAKAAVEKDTADLGSLTYWEFMVIVLFGGAMVAFFGRSPQIFVGWGDLLTKYFDLSNTKFIQDSALAMFVSFLMFSAPNSLMFFKHFTAKYVEDLPKRTVGSVLNWDVLNSALPYSFTFLLGGGFALSTAARVSGLNKRIGRIMAELYVLPQPVVMLLIITVVVFLTNFASNVAIANVFVPISMNLAKQLKKNPLWYTIIAGFSASYCFMLPVGTPGNLVVQSAAKIATGKMIYAGLGPTISTIIISWVAFEYWAPIIWPDLRKMPDWIFK